MKSLITAVALSLVTLAPAWAEDAHHPEGTSATTPAQPPAQAVQKMRDNTARMQAQLDALAGAKTPEDRQRLLMEHMQTMRENMMLGEQMVMGMGGPMGMGGAMPGRMAGCSMMGMPGSGHMMMGPEAMHYRMEQMDKRMDMMQMMLERMARPAPKSSGR